MPFGIVTSINPEVGYEYYSNGVTLNQGQPIRHVTWDVGFDLNYKVMTVDLRYVAPT